MNTKIISILVILVVIVGGFMLFKDRTVAPTNQEVDTVSPTQTNTDADTGTGSSTSATGAVKEFSVDAFSFSFAPSTMTVNKGDTVKITVKNAGGLHDLKIDEFNAATRILNAGESQTITFVADKVGTFEYYCSVGNHRAMGMVGQLVVR